MLGYWILDLAVWDNHNQTGYPFILIKKSSLRAKRRDINWKAGTESLFLISSSQKKIKKKNKIKMISLPHITAISPNRSLLHSFNRPVYTRRHDQRKERTTMSSSSSSPTTAKRVVLVRHGQSTWNEEGRIQGSSDFSVLTTKGESQADISRQMLVEDSFDVCFTRFVDLRMTFLNRFKI